MSIKNKLTSAVRKIKVSRFRTYKKLGFLGHRQAIDRLAKMAFATLLGLASVALLCLRPSDKVNVVSDVIEVTKTTETSLQVHPEVPEVVHEELGDDPVEEEKTDTLTDLEKQVVSGTLKMQSYALEKGETLIGLLTRANLDNAVRSHIIDGFNLLIDL